MTLVTFSVVVCVLSGAAQSNGQNTTADCNTQCVNGGHCEGDSNATLACVCPPSHCGVFCQEESPCLNGGSCVPTAAGPVISPAAGPSCLCPANFTGERCEHPAAADGACSSHPPCPTPQRCVVDADGDPRCECVEVGYHGRYCDIFDKCSESPCRNNGTCIFTGSNSYLCNCNPGGVVTGYHGTDCEAFDPCLTEPCGAGGVCLRPDPSDATNVTCSCDDRHYGHFCQHEDQCLDSPCVNGGTCSTLVAGGYECDCPEGYLGQTCFVSLCSLFFCHNNGTCYIDDASGGPQCQCQRDYYGNRCQYLNACLKHGLCYNGGTCDDVEGDRYRCACADGWTGFRCLFRDLCASSPCYANQTCEPLPLGLYACKCKSAGYFGVSCDRYNSCNDKPCQNGGKCTSLGHRRYECNCTPNNIPTGYFGSNCEHRHPCSLTVPGACSYHGECDFIDKKPGYECVRCDPGYYGTACQWYDGCMSSPCYHRQPCITMYFMQTYYCNCSVQYRGEHCEIPVKCEGVPTSITVSTKGVYFWPGIVIKSAVSVPCELGPGVATRRCEAVVSKGHVIAIFWLSADTSACQRINITQEVAHNLTYYLVHTTSKAEDMLEEEVTSSTDLLLAVIIHAYYDRKLANDIMLCLSNLLDVNETVLRNSSVESETNTKLLSVIDSYAENTVTDANSSATELSTDNIEIKIRDVSVAEAVTSGASFTSSLLPSDVVAISIPAEAFVNGDMLMKGSAHRPCSVRVNFVVMTNTKLFIGADRPPSGFGGWAVSASVIGRPVNSLPEPVLITLPIEEDELDGTPECAFWNEEEGDWDTSGLKLISAENNTAVCESNHLTYFAIIMDPGLSDSISSRHERILSFITKVGISFTVFGLLVTLVSYLLFKQLRSNRSGQILIHLCVSLLGLNLVFLLGSLPSLTSSPASCLTCALLLHYFVLTSFAWMLMEAVNMHQTLVRVFVHGSTSLFVNKCILFSWGMPLAVVIATAITGINTHYGREMNMCLVSKENMYVYYVSYLGPCCVILAVNFVVFGMVINAVCSCRKKQLQSACIKVPKGNVRKTQIGCALSVTFLLGLTWILGLFALRGATLVFQYIFTILNTLQGFFIFLFRCALYPEAVRCWRVLLTDHTLKTRKVPGTGTAVKTNTQNSHGNNCLKVPLEDANKQASIEVCVVNPAFLSEGGSPRPGHVMAASSVPGTFYGMDSSHQNHVNEWEQVVKRRNTLNNIRPRNDI